MKRKYILMSMIAAATLASCSKDDSDNKIDNNNNSVVEVEKTVENGVKETVENSVETISCPVTITVNKGNSVSKVGVAGDGSGEVFSTDDHLRVYLDSKLIGVLDIESAGSATGSFNGSIELPKSEKNEFPTSLDVTVLVSARTSQLSGFSETVYTSLSGAVAANAYLSSSTQLKTSTWNSNGYPSYSATDISLVDQTSYIVFSAGFEGTNVVTINNNGFSLGNGSVLAFEGGLIINSTDLGISNWESAVGKKYNFNLSAVKAITFDKNEINLTTLGATDKLTATIKPSTVTSAEITWSSSANDIVSVDNGTVTALKDGEATITAATANGKSATCLVRVNKKEVTFSDGDNSLKLTYYAEQKISDLNNNKDNEQLMKGYSTVDNYVKFGSKWLKNSENYVTANDKIVENATYTLVDDAPAASITLGDYTIFYSVGQTWEQIAARTDNAGVLAVNVYPYDETKNILNIDDVTLYGGDVVVFTDDVVSSSITYSLRNTLW